MDTMMKEIFTKPLMDSNCHIKENHPFSKLGTCYSTMNTDEMVDYWMYTFEDLFIVSVYNMIFPEDFTQSFMTPNYLCIYYYDSISGVDLVNQKAIKEGAVTGFISNKGKYIATYHGNVPIQGVSISIMPEYFETELVDTLPNGYAQLTKKLTNLNALESHSDLLLILKQLQNCRIKGDSAKLYYQSKVNEVISLILSAPEKESTSISYRNDDKQRLAVVEEYLKLNYYNNPSLSELSRIACMSVSKLKYTFKSVYDCNISQYLWHIRVEKAKELLQTGSYSISQVARSVGYQTTGAFTKMFKEQVGILPKDYRKGAIGPQS